MCRNKVKLLNHCGKGRLAISGCQKRILNSVTQSDLLKISFKYQSLLREMILNQHRNSQPGYGKKELTYTPHNDGLI